MTFYVNFSNFIATVHKETHSINLLTQRMTNLSTLIQRILFTCATTIYNSRIYKNDVSMHSPRLLFDNKM